MPTIADEYLAHLARTGTLGGSGLPPGTDQRGLVADMRSRLQRARRYVVEDDAATAASRLATCNPEILGQLLPGARALHPAIWLEWTHNAQLDGTGFRYEFDGRRPADRLAALIEQSPESESRYRITMFLRQYEPDHATANKDGFVISEMPIGFVFDADKPLSESDLADQDAMACNFGLTHVTMASSLLGLAQVGSIANMTPKDPEFFKSERDTTGQFRHNFRVGKDGMVILSDAAKEQFDITDEEIDARFQVCQRIAAHGAFTLSIQHRSLWEGISKFGDNPAAWPSGIARYLNLIHEYVEERSGLWGFIVALVAMIANPDLVEGSAPKRDGKSRLIRGKPVPFLEHRILKLKLARKATIERTIRAMVGRLPSRRHEVSGHWNTSRRRGNPECEHAWVPLTVSRQSCALCEGLRWWRASFERGDASRGFISKDRLVTRN